MCTGFDCKSKWDDKVGLLNAKISVRQMSNEMGQLQSKLHQQDLRSCLKDCFQYRTQKQQKSKNYKVAGLHFSDFSDTDRIIYFCATSSKSVKFCLQWNCTVQLDFKTICAHVFCNGHFPHMNDDSCLYKTTIH